MTPGKRGLAQIYFPITDSNSILVGNDPSGWFGFPFIAGTWLVKGLTDSSHDGKENTSSLQYSGWKRAAFTATAIGSAVNFLGPVVGLLVANAGARVLDGSKSSKTGSSQDGQTKSSQVVAQSIAEIAIAFGRQRTQVEAKKIIAFYYSIEFDLEVEQSQLQRHGLPADQQALRNLDAVRDELKSVRQRVEDFGLPRSSKMCLDILELIELTLKVQKAAKKSGRFLSK